MNWKFSVCMSIYKNDDPSFFKTAILSVYNQTCPPDEIVLVIDGPIPVQLQEAVESMKTKIPVLKIVPFAENRGHAAARQGGVDNARNELIAIMDSDDVARKDRFEIQLEYMNNHPECSVVGSSITEFVGEESNVIDSRNVYESNEDIMKDLKHRCPMNLMTVLFRKEDVNSVGGFQDWFCEEDYYLWCRMAIAGKKLHNIQQPLVNARVGDSMYARRGGWKYFRSEAKLQRYMLDNQLINGGGYLLNVVKRLIVQILLPNKLRGWVFRKFARS